jgi:beta-lactamase superfamily II metal-dependent hydrolase
VASIARLAIAGLTAAALVSPGRAQAPGVDVELTVLELGPAAATMIRTPTVTLLFDSGPAGARTAERLAQLGVRRLDALVLTGSEPARAAGAGALLAAMPVLRVLDAGGPEGGRFVPPGANYAPLAREIVVGGARLLPLRGEAGGLGVLVSVGAFRALIGGSLTSSEQAAMAGSDLAAPVLVLPRWGRELDPGFLMGVRPRVAIAPAGPVTPDEAVLSLLAASGVAVRRGDSLGDVIVEVAGGQVRVRSVRPPVDAAQPVPVDALWVTGAWGLAHAEGTAGSAAAGPLTGLTRRGRLILGWGPGGLLAVQPGRTDVITLGDAPVVAAALGPSFAYALDGAGAVWVVDLFTAAALGVTAAVRGAPQSLAISADGRWAAVTARGPDELQVIETATGRTTATLELAGPGAIVAIPDGSFLVSTRTPELVVVMPEAGSTGRRVALPEVGQPLAISLDGTLAIAGTSEEPGLLLIDLPGARVISRIRLDHPPIAIAVGAAGKQVAVALHGLAEAWLYDFAGPGTPVRQSTPGVVTGLVLVPQDFSRELGAP